MEHVSNSGFRDWTPDALPDLSGKTYLVTGGNSGIGFEAARMLGMAGGEVIIACRNPQKGADAVERLTGLIGRPVRLVMLDLADLASVRAAANAIREMAPRLDALVNNAGIMQPPKQATADGFEMQFGTNHLGHFLLAGLLFDLVDAAKGRIVTVASIAHKLGRIRFDDLMSTRSYSPTSAYGQSKLANLMFALELHRRLAQAGSGVASIACHPGYSDTPLQSNGPTGLWALVYGISNPLFAQAPDKGAIPTVLAAAGTEAKAGGYYGPQLMGECRGRVSDALASGRARDEADAARLWRMSEELTGFSWEPVLGG